MTVSVANERTAAPGSGTETDLVVRASKGDADAFDRLVATRLRSSAIPARPRT